MPFGRSSFSSRANGSNDDVRRSWINSLNAGLKAGIDYDTIKANPLTLALFGLAMLVASSLNRYAVQRLDERFCVVEHQSS